MKLASHITCIFAIIAQIFLSSVAFAHDVTCQSSGFSTPSVANAPESEHSQHNQSCGCQHDHSSESEEKDHPSDPLAPCTCSSAPVSSFTSADYSVEIRDRKIALIPFTSIYNGESFLTLPNTLSLRGHSVYLSDDVGKVEWSLSLHLPKYSGRFVSTHLSKFLL